MEKNKMKFIIPIMIIFCLLGFTIYKIVKNHEEKLYKSFYGEIEYAAKHCFFNEKCKDKTTLSELYELDYLEIQYDPVSKEILNENIIIEFKDDKVIINK